MRPQAPPTPSLLGRIGPPMTQRPPPVMQQWNQPRPQHQQQHRPTLPRHQSHPQPPAPRPSRPSLTRSPGSLLDQYHADVARPLQQQQPFRPAPRPSPPRPRPGQYTPPRPAPITRPPPPPYSPIANGTPNGAHGSPAVHPGRAAFVAQANAAAREAKTDTRANANQSHPPKDPDAMDVDEW